MARKHDIFPPLDNRRTVLRRRLGRLLVNVFVLVSAGVLYYLVFSLLFDTPSEYLISKNNDRLLDEYTALSERMDEIEAVLDNVEERDRNVFDIMFESEPYDMRERSGSNIQTAMLSMSNYNLGIYLEDSMQRLGGAIDSLGVSLINIYNAIDAHPAALDNIPAVQPIINEDLTLLTASFGMRMHPFYKTLSQHNGIDFTVPEGARVFATADGTVQESSKRPSSSGLTVVIDHGNGYSTRYCHLSKTLVRKGQKVNRGDIIALSGNSGLSLSPHLHYEVIFEGEAVDPVHYFFLELTPDEYDKILRIAASGMQSFD